MKGKEIQIQDDDEEWYCFTCQKRFPDEKGFEDNSTSASHIRRLMFYMQNSNLADHSEASSSQIQTPRDNVLHHSQASSSQLKETPRKKIQFKITTKKSLKVRKGLPPLLKFDDVPQPIETLTKAKLKIQHLLEDLERDNELAKKKDHKRIRRISRKMSRKSRDTRYRDDRRRSPNHYRDRQQRGRAR